LETLPRRRFVSSKEPFTNSDLPHFCSFVVNPNVIDLVVSRFDSFIVQGFPNSVPLLSQRVRDAGKPLTFVPTLRPDGTLGPIDRQVTNACVLQTGAWRECVTDLPVIRIMHGDGQDSKNLPDDFDLPWRSCLTTNQANSIRYIAKATTLNILREVPQDLY